MSRAPLVLALLATSCFSPPPTEGLPCAVSSQCSGDEVCLDGTCQDVGASISSGTTDASSSGAVGTGSSSGVLSAGTDSGSSTSGDTADPVTSGTSSDATSGSGGGSTTGPPVCGGPGEQPCDGLYSHCMDAPDCTRPTPICLVSVDEMFRPIRGSCTFECEQDEDCGPAPGGTAVPTCSGQFTPKTLCFLECSMGETCPYPMACLEVPGSRGTAFICN